MCTVSFVTAGDQIIISSNRDENISREDAKEIHAIESKNKTRLFFPKDPAGGGSWFIVTDKGNAAVLLNGAFEKHIPSYPYRKSRGVILLELLQNDCVPKDFEKTSLERIEPFTIIYYGDKTLYELRWDGITKHQKELSSSHAYIWSSVTLYNEAARKKKEIYFSDFIIQHHSLTEKDVRLFHLQASGDKENGFVIKRSNGIQTRSLTQSVISSSCIHFSHYTLADNQTFQTSIPVIS